MEEEIINKAKKMLTNTDTGTNDCKHYNNGFMDGVEYAIKALRQPPVRSSKKTIGQISDEIEELEDIKNRYEEKGDKISLERAAKTQDKIEALKKEFKDKL
jgi:hypothetical protein